MAQKSQEKGVTGPAPVVDAPGKVRNVVLVGHSGAGKTTLVEALLAVTGTIGRAGSVTEGTTVSDHDPAAVRQQRSVSLACAPVMHDGVKVNLLDTPGYADFVGELRAGLRAADAALFVVSAVDGMDAATAALWEECAAVGMPRAVAISRLDHPRADFDDALAQCREVFGDGVLPLYLPMLSDNGERVDGLMGLITQRVFDYSQGLPADRRGPRPRAPAGHRRRPQRADRGDHRRERGRVAHGALPRRRGDRDLDPHRGPGEGGRPRHVLPGGAGLRGDQGRASTPCWSCSTSAFPSPLEHDLPTVSGVDGSPRAPLKLRPGRSAGGRGRQDDHRLVRGPGVPGPGLLRHPPTGDYGPRVRPRHGVARAPRPRRGRAGRPPLLPARRPAARGAVRPSRATSAPSPSRTRPRPATRSPQRTIRC